MQGWRNRNNHEMLPSEWEAFDGSSANLQDVLGQFRDSYQKMAERPDSFWAHQRKSIMKTLDKPATYSRRNPQLLWVSGALVMLLCLFFFAESGKAPTPDLAAGYDQNLLIEVEEALNREYPDALSPALLLVQEMEKKPPLAKHP